MTDDYEEPLEEVITPKPSELPQGTVIDEPQMGYWFKEHIDTWVEMFPRDASWLVLDSGRPENDDPQFSKYLKEKSDDYFKDFKIISAPLGWEPPRITYNTMIFYDAELKKAARKAFKIYLPERKADE